MPSAADRFVEVIGNLNTAAKWQTAIAACTPFAPAEMQRLHVMALAHLACQPIIVQGDTPFAGMYFPDL